MDVEVQSLIFGMKASFLSFFFIDRFLAFSPLLAICCRIQATRQSRGVYGRARYFTQLGAVVGLFF
jgi:hypothetical protein